MDKLQVYYNNLKNILITRTKEVPVVQQFGYPFLLWNTSLQTYLLESLNLNPYYLTDIELQRLYRWFGHLLVKKLYKVLSRAGHNTNKKTLKYLAKYCYYY